jgi:CHASE2 domain-containing sensor protein
MYKIFFAIGHLLEATFQILVVLGWVPVILTSLTLAFGFIYWLMTQRRYNERARRSGTLA